MFYFIPYRNFDANLAFSSLDTWRQYQSRCLKMVKYVVSFWNFFLKTCNIVAQISSAAWKIVSCNITFTQSSYFFHSTLEKLLLEVVWCNTFCKARELSKNNHFIRSNKLIVRVIKYARKDSGFQSVMLPMLQNNLIAKG